MARPSSVDDDLEPILPRHPPTAPIAADAEGVPDPAAGPPGRSAPTGRSWERWLLVGCALVSTLALVVCAVRLQAIARDERIQACQVEAFVQEQLDVGAGGSGGDGGLRERLAACVGADPRPTSD